MSDAIDRAAEVIRAAIERQADIVADGLHLDVQGVITPHWIAEALATNGLLAPAPLREEWGTRFGGYVVEGRTDAEYPFFWKGVPPPGVNVHRYRTDWLPADGISRAEGDGRDEREPTVPASQLRAFTRLCVDGGDMTPAAARMLDRIIDGDGRAEG